MPSAYDAEREFQGILKTGGGAFIMNKIGTLSAAVRIMNDTEYILISYYKHWIFGVLNAENMDRGNSIIFILYGELKGREKKK